MWKPSKPAFRWEEFLSARAALIQYWCAEGKSYEDISNLVSADAAQVRAINEAMKRCHADPYYNTVKAGQKK